VVRMIDKVQRWWAEWSLLVGAIATLAVDGLMIFLLFKYGV
jgi:hypothetical protein